MSIASDSSALNRGGYIPPTSIHNIHTCCMYTAKSRIADFSPYPDLVFCWIYVSLTPLDTDLVWKISIFSFLRK